jgi:hypothetical protein
LIPLPDLTALARKAMWAVVLGLSVWIVFAAGEANVSRLNLRTIDNSIACVNLTHRAIEIAEQSADLHVSRQQAVAAFLRGGERGEVVVSSDMGGDR